MAYAHKVDGNQAEIVEALRACGAQVLDLSGVGHGVPDLLVDLNGTFWVEVKTKSGKLTPAEQEFWQTWPGEKYVLRSQDEALELAQQRRG